MPARPLLFVQLHTQSQERQMRNKALKQASVKISHNFQCPKAYIVPKMKNFKVGKQGQTDIGLLLLCHCEPNWWFWVGNCYQHEDQEMPNFLKMNFFINNHFKMHSENQKFIKWMFPSEYLKLGSKQGDCRKEPRRDPLCTKTKINQNS